MKTREELIERALKNLGTLPSGHVANAEDAEAMDALIDPMIFQLNLREIVYLADTLEFPDEYFLSLAECLSWVAAPEFGATLDPARLRSDGRPKAEDELRMMQAARPGYGILKTDYY